MKYIVFISIALMTACSGNEAPQLVEEPKELSTAEKKELLQQIRAEEALEASAGDNYLIKENVGKYFFELKLESQALKVGEMNLIHFSVKDIDFKDVDLSVNPKEALIEKGKEDGMFSLEVKENAAKVTLVIGLLNVIEDKRVVVHEMDVSTNYPSN